MESWIGIDQNGFTWNPAELHRRHRAYWRGLTRTVLCFSAGFFQNRLLKQQCMCLWLFFISHGSVGKDTEPIKLQLDWDSFCPVIPNIRSCSALNLWCCSSTNLVLLWLNLSRLTVCLHIKSCFVVEASGPVWLPFQDLFWCFFLRTPTRQHTEHTVTEHLSWAEITNPGVRVKSFLLCWQGCSLFCAKADQGWTTNCVSYR